MFLASPFFAPADEELRYLPEGPRVLQNHPDGGNLLGWVAIQHAADQMRGSINVLNLATGENRRFRLPGRPGFFAETTKPGIVLVGLERRLVYCCIATGAIEETGITVTDDERVIINEGLPIPGGVLFGTKHLQFNKTIAALYHFDAYTGTVRTVVGEQICSNGKFFTRDAEGVTVIDIDSLPKSITRYHLSADLTQIRSRTLLTPPESLPGFPDGLRPAPDGRSIIVAFYNPEAVSEGRAQQVCIDTGKVLAEWTIPGSPRVTCPEFIRTAAGKVKLIFTTAVEGMPPEIRAISPQAGTMFIADTPFTALPAPPPLLPYPAK